MPIKATWCLSNNLGDALNVWLIRKINGETPIYIEPHVTCPKYICCGSILSWAKANTTVWGAGIAYKNDNINPNIEKVLAVRGPISQQRVHTCTKQRVSVLGDPAFLLPKLYQPHVEKKYATGLIPHYVHQLEVVLQKSDRKNVKFINVFSSVEEFVNDICSCDHILSSSLHGCIIAAAYGVSFSWVEYSKPLGGDGTKFYDFLYSIGISGKNLTGQRFTPDMNKINEMQNQLMEVCPFK